ncbi:lasso RiPP family leader peptide-containing protein [Thermoactinomyces sp. CICC 10522]|nr:lasso RiPP family leader peptide-containing protein [Thermoactinomyces sp. CICC 10522]MBH8605595.1 lasso RiPP family leader peptide-containing protein [Thermoactinomyces sp. CICC 10522]
MTYQAPEFVFIGSFEEITLGSKFEDTADLKNYYS